MKTKILTTVRKVTGKPGLWVKKNSPEIMIGVGVAGVIASTVMACKATLKVDDILNEYRKNDSEIDFVFDDLPEQYSEADYRRDKIVNKVHLVRDLAKAYAPAAIVGTASLFLILGSHRILKKRNVALAAAYKLVDEGFEEYRKRVVADVGEEKDLQYRYGLEEEKSKEKYTDKEGKERTRTVKTPVAPGFEYSVYAKFFDETNPRWQHDPEYNLLFLKAQQNYLNDLLHSRGHLFLNEVYEELGMSHTRAGAVVGWVVSKDGDNYVDFNIFNRDSGAARDFVNGYNNSILLDFNVDGVIYDKI